MRWLDPICCQTYEHQSLFVNAADKFNDWNYKTGGLIVKHEQFLDIESSHKGDKEAVAHGGQ